MTFLRYLREAMSLPLDVNFDEPQDLPTNQAKPSFVAATGRWRTPLVQLLYQHFLKLNTQPRASLYRFSRGLYIGCFPYTVYLLVTLAKKVLNIIRAASKAHTSSCIVLTLCLIFFFFILCHVPFITHFVLSRSVFSFHLLKFKEFAMFSHIESRRIFVQGDKPCC